MFIAMAIIQNGIATILLELPIAIGNARSVLPDEFFPAASSFGQAEI
jgi:hypothetical protein